jgi:hypothetical protein
MITGNDVARLADGDHRLHGEIEAALHRAGYMYSAGIDTWLKADTWAELHQQTLRKIGIRLQEAARKGFI